MKKQILIICMFLLVVLSGCSNVGQAERVLQSIYDYEKEMNDIQGKIYELDEKEATMYEEMLRIHTKDKDEMKKVSKAAQEIIKEKQTLLNEEYEIHELAKKKLSKIEEIQSKEQTNTLLLEKVEILNERNTTYEALHEKLSLSVDLHEQLYDLLLKESDQAALKKLLHDINENEAALQSDYKNFNKLTERFNTLKLDTE